MDEVESALRKVVGKHVVDAHLEVEMRPLAQHRRVEVGGEHRAAGSDAIAQPPGDRTAAPADLETAPTGLDAARLQVSDRPRIEQHLERA